MLQPASSNFLARQSHKGWRERPPARRFCRAALLGHDGESNVGVEASGGAKVYRRFQSPYYRGNDDNYLWPPARSSRRVALPRRASTLGRDAEPYVAN